MKTLLLKIKQKSGLLSELQSDTIYGHFCWRLKERLGEDKLKEFISLYRNGNPVFLLSDGLPTIDNEIQFPNPFVFRKFEVKKEKSEKILDFVHRKHLKENKYISLNQLNEFLETCSFKPAEIKSESKEKSQKHITENLRVSVQIDRNTFASAEGKLFSYSPSYSGKNVTYSILIKTIDDTEFDTFECKNLFREVFEVGFGKKKSSGYGQFEIIDEIKVFDGIKEPKDANAFMVLGNYLPSTDDKAEPIGYDLNTKYGKLGEELSQSDNPFKNPIVLLTAGSCFKEGSKKEFYGRVTDDGEVSPANSFVVQFGMPFVLKFNYNP